ncbi:hypothetical protein VTL71DRAFT_317 [Oculimacula yallundae]|uniref:Uncharacterized protein n=1 Tax=Oculimacula yallundae TaxID=86028 RepID=A0ABR4CZP1_9HELO
MSGSTVLCTDSRTVRLSYAGLYHVFSVIFGIRCAVGDWLSPSCRQPLPLPKMATPTQKPCHLIKMSLLLIPHELRDQILALVVLSTVISPPHSPANPEEREQLKDANCNGWFGGSGVLYQKDTQLSGIPTLGVNKQLRDETLSVLERFKLGGLRSYKLDVMVFEDSQLWPTWLNVPTTTSRVEEVHATFRIHGASPTRSNGFRGGDGGPPLITWSFFNLLERFLLVGPMSKQHKCHDRHIKIRHLILDFRTPDVPAEMLAPDIGQNKLAVLRRRSGINYIRHPKSVLDFVGGFLGWLSGTRERGIVSVCYERVGRITLTLDGVVIEERDITPCVSNMNSVSSEIGQQLPPVFEDWDLKNSYTPEDIEWDKERQKMTSWCE